MKRAGLVGVGVLAALVAGSWLARPTAPWPGTWRAATARGGSATPNPPRLLADLGLPDAGELPLRVIQDEPGTILVVYPVGVDPVDTAARWSLAIGRTGLKKTADASRAGRTVLTFARGEATVLLAVGRTTAGPFVSVSYPVTPDHWAFGKDEDAPAALVALLPRPAEEPKGG